jgi:hypothetical protein
MLYREVITVFMKKKKKKGKFIPVHVMQAYRGRSSIAPLIPNVDTRGR